MKFKLLVRFLTGIQNYIELQDIFKILIENDSFELLLMKNPSSDASQQNELKMGLIRYLQSYKDNSKLELIYLSFNMWYNMAESLEQKVFFPFSLSLPFPLSTDPLLFF